MVCGKAPEHNADHGETGEGSNGAGIALEVARQASVAADPCERPLDDPAFWQNLKSGSIRSLDDLQSPNAGAPCGPPGGSISPLYAGVAESPSGKFGFMKKRLQQGA